MANQKTPLTEERKMQIAYILMMFNIISRRIKMDELPGLVRKIVQDPKFANYDFEAGCEIEPVRHLRNFFASLCANAVSWILQQQLWVHNNEGSPTVRLHCKTAYACLLHYYSVADIKFPNLKRDINSIFKELDDLNFALTQEEFQEFSSELFGDAARFVLADKPIKE